jgi:hypothetical protein
MKIYFLPVLLLFYFNSCAQSSKITEIKQKESVKLIESILSFERFEGRQLWAQILKISNGSGSAKSPGTEEVSYSIVISLAHYDEYPKSKLYKIGPFVDPKVVRKVDSGDAITFYIKDENARHIKTYKLQVSETKSPKLIVGK